MKQAVRQKNTNKIAQKSGVIIIKKAQKNIISKKVNKVLLIDQPLIWVQKVAYQVVIGPWLNFVKEENTFWMIIKKDIKAKKQLLVLLFQKLKEFIKKKNFGDILLSVIVGWLVLQLRWSAFYKI